MNITRSGKWMALTVFLLEHHLYVILSIVVGPFLYCVSLWKFQENVSNLPRDPVLLQYTSSVSALLSPQMEPSSHSQTVFAKGCWIGACTSNSFPSVSVFVEIYLLQSLDKYLSLIEKQYLQVLCAYKNLSLLDIIFLFSEQKYTALAYPKAHFCCFSILCRAAITSLNL